MFIKFTGNEARTVSKLKAQGEEWKVFWHPSITEVGRKHVIIL